MTIQIEKFNQKQYTAKILKSVLKGHVKEDQKNSVIKIKRAKKTAK